MIRQMLKAKLAMMLRLCRCEMFVLILFSYNIIQMGSTQSQESMFILDDYTYVKQQSNMKVLQQKHTQQYFILKEQSFLQRSEYDRQFKQLAIRDDINSTQNILKLKKLWSKQHSGLCSHLYKIYSVYEYPQVKLIDEVEARRQEAKYFQEMELVSVLQSCINAIGEEPRFTNLSTHLIFIEPEGILKIINYALVDPHHRSIYHQHYFYSPQKFHRFNDENLESSQALEKETVFNLGMIILHCGLLQNPSKCYELSLGKFRIQLLEDMIAKIRERYSFGLGQLLRFMLMINADKRVGLSEIQQLINELFNESSSSPLRQTLKEGSLSPNIQPLSNHQKKTIMVESKNGSLLYSKDTYEKQPFLSYNSETNIKGNQLQGQMQLFELSNNVSLPKNHYILSRNKKTKEKCTQKQNKSNLKDLGKKSIEQEFKRKPLYDNNCQFIGKEREMGRNDWFEGEIDGQVEIGSRMSRCVFVIQNYEDNSKYQGMMRNNLKNGYGKLTYQDGVYFEGNFKNDGIDGKGVLYYGINRPAYFGDWVNNKFHGKGVLYNEFPVALNYPFDYTNFNDIQDFWIKFEGQFHDDIKEGRGKIYLSNGEMLDGTFKKGLLNGEGTYHKLDGGQVQKTWVNNVMA